MSNSSIDIINYSVSNDCYYGTESEKKQIYLHASLFCTNPYRLIDHYSTNNKSYYKTAPSFIVSFKSTNPTDNYTDGTIIQLYQSKYWSHHLHLKQSHLVQGGPGIDLLSRESISVELCSWGPLIETEHGICSSTGIYIDNDDIYEFSTPYRGYKFYHKYSEGQIEGLRKLLTLINKKWNIDIKFKGNGIFNVDRRALMGQNGVYCHNSVRPDIVDISPQTHLVEMLNSL